MAINTERPEDWLCKNYCFYYKPDKNEEQRCRCYNLAQILTEERPQWRMKPLSAAFDSSFKKQFLLTQICAFCPFYIQDCDFTSDKPPEGCPPCGGLVFISDLLKRGEIHESDLRLANMKDLRDDSYVSLSRNTSIKRLETDFIYHMTRDELYEINEDALDFLSKCDGSSTLASLAPDREFLEFCIVEELLTISREKKRRRIDLVKSPIPSLRYLEWLVTRKCNLSCAHCYLGDQDDSEFDQQMITPLLDEFTRMQGLRVLVSGGEPTLYKHFSFLNGILPEYPVRSVLLTNGTTMTVALAKRLNFHEVQVSLDGMEKGHEAIRGKGSFKKAIRAMEIVSEAGIDLSVATMVHRFNLDEWDAMKDLVESMGVREWSVDYPCVKGRWASNPELQAGLQEAADRMGYAFGGSYHGTSSGWTCGRHLAAVLPSGDVCKCGLFPQLRVGAIDTGLAEAWSRMAHVPISETDCDGCDNADLCGGGCRFRAGCETARDEVMCFLHKN